MTGQPQALPCIRLRLLVRLTLKTLLPFHRRKARTLNRIVLTRLVLVILMRPHLKKKLKEKMMNLLRQ